MIDRNKILMEDQLNEKLRAWLINERNMKFHFYLDERMERSCKEFQDIKGKLCKIRPVEIYGEMKPNSTVVERKQDRFEFLGFEGTYLLDCLTGRNKLKISKNCVISLPPNCTLVGEDVYIKAVPRHWSQVREFGQEEMDVLEEEGEDLLREAKMMQVKTGWNNTTEKLGAGDPRILEGEDGETNDWTDLDQVREEQQRHTELLQKMSKGHFWHPITTGIVGGSLLIIMILGMGVLCWLYVKCKRDLELSLSR